MMINRTGRRPVETAVRLESGKLVYIQWQPGAFDSLDEVLDELLARKLRERHAPWRSSPTPEV